MAKKNQLTTSDHLEYSEYNRLLESLRADKEYIWELYARLSFCTACRVSDVLNLKWSDILNKKNVCVTEQKTKKTRIVPFNESVVEKISELYGLLKKPAADGFVFQTERSKGHFTVQHVNQKLKVFRVKYQVKIDHFSTHTFRKTFGRYVYETNNKSAESLLLLNKVLNHSNIAVTKVYIGITKDEINSIYNSIRF